MTIEAKKTRKTYQGEKNNKERTMNSLIAAVGEVLKEKGYVGLTIANISKTAGVDRKLVSLYFGSVDNLVETYLKARDFWKASVTYASQYFGSSSQEGTKGYLQPILLHQLDRIMEDVEMQKILSWQVSEGSDLMDYFHRDREQLNTLILAFGDKELENSGVDLRALCSLLLCGLQYYALYSLHTRVPLFGIVPDEDGLSRIKSVIKDILDRAYSLK